jgi:hypothetical protein
MTSSIYNDYKDLLKLEYEVNATIARLNKAEIFIGLNKLKKYSNDNYDRYLRYCNSKNIISNIKNNLDIFDLIMLETLLRENMLGNIPAGYTVKCCCPKAKCFGCTDNNIQKDYDEQLKKIYNFSELECLTNMDKLIQKLSFMVYDKIYLLGVDKLAIEMDAELSNINIDDYKQQHDDYHKNRKIVFL